MLIKEKPQKTVATILRFHLFKNEELDFQFIRTLAYTSADGAAIGECLYAASRINEHDPETWVSAWGDLGAFVESEAKDSLSRGHTVSARKAFLRAYNYYRNAEFFASVRTTEAADLYWKSLACFDQAGTLFNPTFETIRIPYENKVLPGHFFRPNSGPEPRPTVILCGGGDASGEELYFLIGREAIERGYNAIVFHGPGHRGALHRDASLVFRADYEEPLRAVVDYALSVPDVDPNRLVLIGISLGGYLASRAAATDHRIRAFIPNSPIVDYHRILTSIVETKLGPLPSSAETIVFNFVSHFLPKTLLEYVCWTCGVTRITDYLEVNKAFKLGDLPQQITCPTLCLHSEGEGEEASRQTMEFYNALQCPKQLHNFTVEEGADSHCQINNLGRSNQIIFDWLDETTGSKSHLEG